MEATQTTRSKIRSDKIIQNLAISDAYEEHKKNPVMLKTKKVARMTNEWWRAPV